MMPTVNEAAQMLGKSAATLWGADTHYRQFIISPQKGVKNASFDIKGYETFMNLRESLVSQCQLFVEYLRHEEGMSYNTISELTGVNSTTLTQMTYGFGNSLKIARAMKSKRPYHFKRYHDYYKYNYVILRHEKR